jgi:hypothetical protein
VDNFGKAGIRIEPTGFPTGHGRQDRDKVRDKDWRKIGGKSRGKDPVQPIEEADQG